MDFFKTLHKRIEIKPDSTFDRKFWAEFNREFGSQKASWARVWAWGSGGRHHLQQFAAVCGLFVAMGSFWYFHARRGIQSLEFTQEAELATHADFLDHLELVETLEDPNMNDEEWGILLSQN